MAGSAVQAQVHEAELLRVQEIYESCRSDNGVKVISSRTRHVAALVNSLWKSAVSG